MQEKQEYKAKVMEIGGMLRGWIPSRIISGLKARNGDYIVFNKDAQGNIIATSRRATVSEKKKSAARVKAASKK